MADDSQTWGSRKWRSIQKRQARVNQNNRATPNLDAARAELASGPKLVVESLEEKLERALPGAKVEDSGVPGEFRYRVMHRGKYAWRPVGTGGSRREAIDRAIFLFGGR